MKGTIGLGIFPNIRFDTLTLLYLQNQDLTGLTPEQVLDKYDEAYDRIRNHYQETRNDRRCVKWTET